MTSPVAFIIILFAAFALTHLFQISRNKENKAARLFFVIACLILTIQMVKTMCPPSSGRYYEINAVKWIEAKKLPDEKVFYDGIRLRYYAGDYDNDQNLDWSGMERLFQNGAVYNYQYIVIHGPKKHPERIQFMNERLGTPIIQFDNGRKNRVLVYRVPQAFDKSNIRNDKS